MSFFCRNAVKYESDDAINDMVKITTSDDKIIESSSSQQTPKMESKIYNVTSRDDGVTWGEYFIMLILILDSEMKN